MDKKVIITNSEGRQVEADVITVFTLNDNNKDYIVYTFNEKQNDDIKTYTSRIREENGEYYFDSITDENEWAKVRNVIIELAENKVN